MTRKGEGGQGLLPLSPCSTPQKRPSQCLSKSQPFGTAPTGLIFMFSRSLFALLQKLPSAPSWPVWAPPPGCGRCSKANPGAAGAVPWALAGSTGRRPELERSTLPDASRPGPCLSEPAPKAASWSRAAPRLGPSGSRSLSQPDLTTDASPTFAFGGAFGFASARPAAKRAAGWTSREETDPLRPPRIPREARTSRGFRTSRTPRLFRGRPAVRPFREPLVPPSIGKCGAACGAVSSPAAAGRSTPLAA